MLFETAIILHFLTLVVSVPSLSIQYHNSVPNGLYQPFPFGRHFYPYQPRPIGQPLVVTIPPQRPSPIELHMPTNFIHRPNNYFHRPLYPVVAFDYVVPTAIQSGGHYGSDYLPKPRPKSIWSPHYNNFVFNPITGKVEFRKPYNGGFIEDISTNGKPTGNRPKPTTEAPAVDNEDKTEPKPSEEPKEEAVTEAPEKPNGEEDSKKEEDEDKKEDGGEEDEESVKEEDDAEEE